MADYSFRTENSLWQESESLLDEHGRELRSVITSARKFYIERTRRAALIWRVKFGAQPESDEHISCETPESFISICYGLFWSFE